MQSQHQPLMQPQPLTQQQQQPQPTKISWWVFLISILMLGLSSVNVVLMKKLIQADETKKMFTSQEMRVVKLNYHGSIAVLSFNVVSFVFLCVYSRITNNFILFMVDVLFAITVLMNFIFPFIFEFQIIYNYLSIHSKSKQLVGTPNARFVQFYNYAMGSVVALFLACIFVAAAARNRGGVHPSF